MIVSKSFWLDKSMRWIITIFLIGIFLIIVSVGGWYPVALVNTTPIFYRTWKNSEIASKNFTQTQLRAAKNKSIDFSSPENAQILLEVKRGTLTFLVEDAIIKKEGEKFVGFSALAYQKVNEAVKDSDDLASAARAVYGISLDDFYNFVLLPQARRDVLKDVLGSDFDSWFASVKREKKIRLFFVPFRWDGEAVK